MSTPFVEIRMRDKCSTCAFRSGTYPNQDGITLIKAKLCADTATPFLCHEAERDAMCAGFADFLTRYIETSEYKNQPEWRHEVKLKMLEMIDLAEEADAKGLPPPDYVEFMRKSLKETEK